MKWFSLFPIVFIYLFLTYTSIFARWSHTILGRLVAITLIVVYTKIDWMIGLLVCALVILFYQSDYVEAFTPKQNAVEKMTGLGEEAVAKFRQEYCKNGHLMHKNMRISDEMSEHVFPEIVNPAKCSVCDTKCSIDILETRMKDEHELIRVRNSNDWVDIAFNVMTGQSTKD